MTQVYVALDLEATGMDPARDEVIEIGAIKFRNGQIIDEFETMVRPRSGVSFGIQTLTGLSNDDLKDAPRFAAVAPRLRDFVRNAPIVGQSIGFDLDMLSAAGLGFENRRYDTFEMATVLLPELPTYDLGTIANALGVPASSRHRAVADAETAMHVFSRLLHRIEAFDDHTLSRMIELTRVSRSSLNHLFSGLLRERRNEVEGYGGSSIGAAMLAKLGSTSSASPEAAFLVSRSRPPKLEPTGVVTEIPEEVLKDALAPGGAVARAMPGYEVRPQQLDMMLQVARTINSGGQSLIEAGTGTGKSLGYLLPAALHAVEQGDPVVVSTATIALQDQLMNKDVPALRAAAKLAAQHDQDSALAKLEHLNVSVLKGRANYLCLRRWFLAQREPLAGGTQAQMYAKVTAWLQSTETGDRAELRLSQDEQAHWPRLAEEEGSCVPAQCVFHRRNQCFLFRARAEAESSHIVVVNHSLLMTDLLRGRSVIPAYRHLIIDEAHHLESEATNQAGYSVSRAMAVDLVRRVVREEAPVGVTGALGLTFKAIGSVTGADARATAAELQELVSSGLEAAKEAEQRIDQVFQSLGEVIDRYDNVATGYERRVRVTHAIRSNPDWTQVEIEWDTAAKPVGMLIEIVQRFISIVEPFEDEQLPTRMEILTELDLLESQLQQTRFRLYELLCQSGDDLVAWLSKHQNTGETSVHAVPLHVADMLRDELYRRTESVTLTSATLTIDSTFDYMRDRLGLEDAVELAVPSPFNYRDSTLLAIANDIPEPNQPGHQKAVQNAILETVRASGGRAMVLFTSHNALQSTYRAVKSELERDGILVLGQRLDGSPRQLVERLLNTPSTVVFGTNSFWEGVDIAGEALSLLVITRLPFSVPSDPIFAARSELFDEPFIDFAVPQAVLRFKQGFGRLIRSAEDRGACVVLDRRVVSRRYGELFVTSLPECEFLVGATDEVADSVRDWLAGSNASSV
jgi:predicted DnaQ family exonuclease/DinG family helicase